MKWAAPASPVVRGLVATAILGSATSGCFDFDRRPVEGGLGGAGASSAQCDAQQGRTCVFVSPAGDDTNTGLDPTAPKRSIKSALVQAKSLGPDGIEVHICKGTYPEASLVLDVPTSLRGGYDCSTWKRDATMGVPTTERGNESILTNADYATSPVTLGVTGSAVVGVDVEGLTIFGAPSGRRCSAALRVAGGAAPRVLRNRLFGGSASDEDGCDAAAASVGLTVDEASPEVANNWIDGGSGTTGVTGSIGVSITGAGRPSVHDNDVRGGSGTGRKFFGSIGINLATTGELTVATGAALRGNTIDAGTGHCSNCYSAGLLTQGTGTLEVLGNTLRGGAPAEGTGFGVLAIHGSILLRGNRIDGGTASTGTTGVAIRATIHARLVNNMIAAGASATNDARGVWLEATSGVELLQNTIGALRSSKKRIALYLSSDVAASRIENNLFLGGEESISYSSCASTFSSLRGNAFVLEFGLLRSAGPDCSAAPLETRLSNLYANISGGSNMPPPAAFDSNVRIGPGPICNGDGPCAPFAPCASDATACLSALVDDWGADPTGDAGWKLNDSIPCAIARSNLDLTSEVSDDFFGAPRCGPRPTIGASEVGCTAACIP